MDGDALEPGPLCIAQLDGLEVQWPSHLVCFGGNEARKVQSRTPSLMRLLEDCYRSIGSWGCRWMASKMKS